MRGCGVTPPWRLWPETGGSLKNQCEKSGKEPDLTSEKSKKLKKKGNSVNA
jgi:hypothetical protein